jgi:ectoine hydroxylase
MLPDSIMSYPLNVLDQTQRASFFAKGYLALENYVPQSWLERLTASMNALIDASRSVTESNKVYMLEDGHSAEDPRLHRITSPQDQDELYWQFLTDPVVTDLVADLVGPDVKFHHSKLNVKSGKGSRGIKWHQDIGAHPHTDFSPLAFGVYLEGCDIDQGPLAFAPGSQNGPLYSMYDKTGNFVIHIADDDVSWIKDDMIEAPTGGPGTVVLLNCRVVHGSLVNRSPKARPLLLSSADSFPYSPSPIPSSREGAIVRGKPATRASFDLRPVEMPPDFRFGYRGAWSEQKDEEKRLVAR